MRDMTLSRAAIGVFCALTFVPISAEATISSVTVKTTRDYENAAGYTYAEITIQGTVDRGDGSVGLYSVPAVLIHPRQGRGNGVGVVDWLNSAFYHFFPPTTEFGTHAFTLLATGNYLFEEGYTYVSVQWDKAVTEFFGPITPRDSERHNHMVYGSIDRSADAWEILLDAARLLKNPKVYPGSDRPARVTTVLSSGYSQGGALQLELLAERLDPTRVYDGHLVQMIGLTCWKREDVAPYFGSLAGCKALPTKGDHAPVILLASETDMLVYHPTLFGVGKSAYFTRNQRNPHWRQFEMAGISHLPEPILAVTANQNTADARPIFRAAFASLTRWTHGKYREKPPAPRYFSGTIDATEAFVPTMDADGHFAGGLRLPHVESMIHGRVAGAPLGRHSPVKAAGLDPFDAFAILGGTFSRFTDDDLLDRYASRRQYVKRVRRAADDLAARGYITDKDRRALLVAAVEEPLPCHRGDDDGNDIRR